MVSCRNSFFCVIFCLIMCLYKWKENRIALKTFIFGL